MRKRQRGAILIFTLAILTAIIAILAAAAANGMLQGAAVSNRVETMRAELQADAGLQTALSVLATESTSVVSQQDPWFTLGDNGSDKFITDDGSYRMQIIDAGSLINLNSATTAILQNLPLTQVQMDCLLDWVQVSANPRSDGAKDSFYNGLTNPYNTAEGPLHSLDELLLVNNFTPAALFTVQPTINGVESPEETNGDVNYQPTLYDLATVDSASFNTNAQGTALVNVNSATVPQLESLGLPANAANSIYNTARRTPYTTLGAVLGTAGITLQNASTILNNLTVSTAAPTGKIDINTANQAVLQCLPNITSDIAQGISSQQTNAGFTTLGAITQVPGMTLSVLRQTADFFTINSQAFLVRVIGTAGSISVPLEAVITITPTTAATATTSTTPNVKITKVYHPAFNNMISHWHWDNQTTTDVDLRTGT